MKKEQFKILGIQVTRKKDSDVKYYNYFYETLFDDYAAQNSEIADGVVTGKEFSYEDLGVNVGDIVEFKYSKGFGGKAVVSGCRLIEPAPKQNVSK